MLNKIDRIGALLVVKDIFVSYRKNETILFLLSLKRYFCHPKQSILNKFCKIYVKGIGLQICVETLEE